MPSFRMAKIKEKLFRSLFLRGREMWENMKGWAVWSILHTGEYSILATSLARGTLCRLAPRQQHGKFA